jgi:hypothetical protein
MNSIIVSPYQDQSATEHRAPIARPREDPFFQGWGPRL